jgi:NAD(P)-dependent dehydrogenase (short-subunit alcohol dehydrogenase family)
MASKYAAPHITPKGPGDARPTALQIIQDEGLEDKLQDKTFLITGCSSGIGVETARAIAATGATTYCTVRDMERGKTALSDILEPGRVELLHMDLSSLASVRAGARDFFERNKGHGLNVLICNAGVMAIPTLTRTTDGFETQFGTNHLAHFLLFNLLKDTLIKSSIPSFNSRVVMVSSSGHRGGPPRFADYNYVKHPDEYSPFGAYASSKCANVYMANYIDRHYGSSGLHATSLHPGGIWTPLQKHVEPETLAGWRSAPNVDMILKSTAQGASTTVWAAVSKEWEGTGGKYLVDCQVAPQTNENATPHDVGHAPHAYNPEGEERQWKDSLGMVGLES